MNRSDVEEHVRKIVAKIFDVPPDEIRRETGFEALGADSLHIVELGMAIEETFGIEIAEATARQLGSVQSVIDYVLQHADLK